MDETNENTEHLSEIKLSLEELSRELRKTQVCIARFNNHFDEKYKPLLEQMIVERDYWRDIKKDAIKGTVKASLWATILGTLTLIGLGAVHYAKEILGINQ